MLFTQTTVNAIQFLMHIADNPGRHSATDIAAHTDVTRPFTRKILMKLESAGIIKGSVGRSGGYELARPAKKILLCDIVETVEGPVFVIPAFNPNKRKAGGAEYVSPANDFFAKMQEHIGEILDNHTLADIMEGSFIIE